MNGKDLQIERVMFTPEMAEELLHQNKNNRPLSDAHVERICKSINEGRWKFNGDTIKVSHDGDIIDGQHRSWAVVYAQKPVETIIVRGIARDAFSTIDTIRKPRGGGDVVALLGDKRNRNAIATAITWLIRWQNETITEYKSPRNRIENSHIEESFIENKGIVRAVERVSKLRGVMNTGMLGFVYYITANRNPKIAEQLAEILTDPSGASINHPFYKLRNYLHGTPSKRRDPLHTLALTFKAINSVAAGKSMAVLSWRSQGDNPEPFPNLKV